MSTATPFSIDDVLRHGANVPAIPRVVAGAVRLPPGMDGKKFWRHCLHTGVVAR